MNVLEVEGLHVAHGGVEAVHDVSFEVGAGEVLALLGANGAGKTSTLLAVSRLVPPSAGRVRVNGHDLAGMPPETVARLGVAHVLADRGTFGSLTVADNLRMGLYGSGRDGTDPGRLAVEEVLELFPVLRERRNQPAGQMSGGQQQQLAIARALVQDPRLLLLDEMSMGLAPGLVVELFDLLGQLRSRGISVVLVEQFVGQALRLADRAVVLEQGRVVADERPENLARQTLAGVYLGGADVVPGSVEAPEAVSATEMVAVPVEGRDLRALQLLAVRRGLPVADVVRQLLEDAVSRELAR